MALVSRLAAVCALALLAPAVPAQAGPPGRWTPLNDAESNTLEVGVARSGNGLLNILWLQYGMLDEWDYWAGTFGLVLVAVVETIIFIWVFKPENAWRSIHQGADIRIPSVFKFVMTFVTPLYLLVILGWWAVQDALPILRNQKTAGGGPPSADAEPYILASRLIMLAFIVGFLVLIRIAWKRNGYRDREGFAEVEPTPQAQEAA